MKTFWKTGFEIFTSTVAIVFIVLAIYGSIDDYINNKIMDSTSFQYDADGLFLIIDKGQGRCGLYNGTTPLEHMIIDDIDLEKGVYNIPTIVK